MNPKRILIFEDDVGEALLMKEELEKGQYQVDTAPSGAKGLELFSKGRYDLVLLDLVMPDMTGIVVFRELRKVSPSILGIMVTGSGDERSAVEALKSGVSDYIVKASNAAHLATLPVVIERALEHKRMKEEREKLQGQLKEYAATLEQKVAERTQDLAKAYHELQEKSAVLERFHKATVDRELQMIKLKDEINALLQELGRPTKYGTLHNS